MMNNAVQMVAYPESNAQVNNLNKDVLIIDKKVKRKNKASLRTN